MFIFKAGQPLNISDYENPWLLGFEAGIADAQGNPWATYEQFTANADNVVDSYRKSQNCVLMDDPDCEKDFVKGFRSGLFRGFEDANDIGAGAE